MKKSNLLKSGLILMTILSAQNAFSLEATSAATSMSMTFSTCGTDGWADVGCAKKELEMERVEGAAVFLEESLLTNAFIEYVEEVQKEAKMRNEVVPSVRDIALELLGED